MLLRCDINFVFISAAASAILLLTVGLESILYWGLRAAANSLNAGCSTKEKGWWSSQISLMRNRSTVPWDTRMAPPTASLAWLSGSLLCLLLPPCSCGDFREHALKAASFDGCFLCEYTQYKRVQSSYVFVGTLIFRKYYLRTRTCIKLEQSHPYEKNVLYCHCYIKKMQNLIGLL